MPMQARETCDRCDKKFPSREALRKHILSEHIKSFSCSVKDCDKVYTYKKSLDNHVAKRYRGDEERRVVEETRRSVSSNPGATPQLAEEAEIEGRGGEEADNNIEQGRSQHDGDVMNIDEMDIDGDEDGVAVEEEREPEREQNVKRTEELRPAVEAQPQSQSASSSDSSDSETGNNCLQRLFRQKAEQKAARAEELARMTAARATPKANSPSLPIAVSASVRRSMTPSQNDRSSRGLDDYKPTPIQTPINANKPSNASSRWRAVRVDPENSPSANSHSNSTPSAVRSQPENNATVSHASEGSSNRSPSVSFNPRSAKPAPIQNQKARTTVSKGKVSKSVEDRDNYGQATPRSVEKFAAEKKQDQDANDDYDMDLDVAESSTTEKSKTRAKSESITPDARSTYNEEEETDEGEDWRSIRKEWKKVERKIEKVKSSMDEEKTEYEREAAKLKKNNKALSKMIREGQMV